jgi:hypothetical protein
MRFLIPHSTPLYKKKQRGVMGKIQASGRRERWAAAAGAGARALTAAAEAHWCLLSAEASNGEEVPQQAKDGPICSQREYNALDLRSSLRTAVVGSHRPLVRMFAPDLAPKSKTKFNARLDSAFDSLVQEEAKGRGGEDEGHWPSRTLGSCGRL